MVTDDCVVKELKVQRRIFKAWLKKTKKKKHVGVEAQENRKKNLVLRFLHDHNHNRAQDSMVKRFMMGRGGGSKASMNRIKSDLLGKLGHRSQQIERFSKFSSR